MPYKNRDDRLANLRDWQDKNRDYMREYQAEWRRAQYNSRRPAAIEALGGVCAACGITDWRVLDIDHIDGGGHKERQSKDRLTMMKQIIDGTRTHEFQLLCCNCHRLKTLEQKKATRTSTRRGRTGVLPSSSES